MRPLQPTSRSQLLALAEYTRRRESGLPGAGLALGPYELRVFSQNGEDGVLGEVLRRTGLSAPGFFVEFGGEDGVETNCGLLADVFGWSGVFFEGDPAKHHHLHRKYAPTARVRTGNAMITADNIEPLLRDFGVPAEFDVLSIDVDGDDYWIWRAVTDFSPKVVVIEINAHLDPREPLVQPQGSGGWQGTDFYGASVEAVRRLGAAKGYRLVHIDLTGNNAFFVRGDVPGQYPDTVTTLGPNHFLLGGAHPADETGRAYIAPPE